MKTVEKLLALLKADPQGCPVCAGVQGSGSCFHHQSDLDYIIALYARAAQSEIEAVPDLVEALKELLSYVEPKTEPARTKHGLNGKIIHAHRTELASIARAALEKAGVK